MTLQIVNTSRWFDGQRLHQVGSITITGSYLTPFGEPLSFADGEIKSSRIPDVVEIHGQTGGHQYAYRPGTDVTDGTMLVFFAGVDLLAAVYPAAVLNDVVTYHAIFKMR